jgi:hypothetical protein
MIVVNFIFVFIETLRSHGRPRLSLRGKYALITRGDLRSKPRRGWGSSTPSERYAD